MTGPETVLAAAVGDGLRHDPRSVPEAYDVPPAAWHEAVAALRAAGFTYLDFLTGVDRPDEAAVEVVAHLAAPDDRWRHLLLRTRTDAAAPGLASVADLHLGAAWHERETREMFGVEFAGGDPRPLLLTVAAPVPPLRKHALLTARGVVPWPGAADPADGPGGNPSRRRVRAPGVPEGWPRGEGS